MIDPSREGDTTSKPVVAVVHMIKLTETREITPYLLVHPNEERWGRQLRRPYSSISRSFVPVQQSEAFMRCVKVNDDDRR
jgi:hypothetical protein